MSEELKPCPFCGREAPFDQWPCGWLDGSGANVIRCAWCHGAAPAKVWNRRALSAHASAGEGVPEITPALAGWFIAALGDIPDDYQRITTEQVMEALRANVEHFTATPQPAAAQGGELDRLADTLSQSARMYNEGRTTMKSVANDALNVAHRLRQLAAAPQPQPTINSSEIDSKLTDARPATPASQGERHVEMPESWRFHPSRYDYESLIRRLRECRGDDNTLADMMLIVRDIQRGNLSTPPAHGDGEAASIVDRLIATAYGDGLAQRSTWSQGLMDERNHVLRTLTTRPTPEAQEARDADTKRLDWIAREALFIVVNAKHFGMKDVQVIKPTRAAIDAALALPAQGEGAV